jgi:hypothetical protein
MRIRFEYSNLLGLYFSRLINRDIFGIILAEDSIAVMRMNGSLNSVLNTINSWIIDLFLEGGLKVSQFLSSEDVLTAKKYLKDFDLLICAEELDERVGSKELLHYNNYATQLVNMNIKY